MSKVRAIHELSWIQEGVYYLMYNTSFLDINNPYQ